MLNERMNRRTLCQIAGLSVAAVSAGTPLARVGAQGATPAAVPSTVGLAEMLALAPASLPGVEDPAQLVISFSDFATQLGSPASRRPPRWTTRASPHGSAPPSRWPCQ